jgi:glycosyltransferase involved in cell wall biosynthesis
VEESVKSVLAQTEPDLELIIVDDASTDGSRELIDRLAKSDGRIEAFYHDKNSGASTSRNDGLSMAEGEYIAFCDADDIWLPGKLKKQLALLADTPAASIAYSDARIIDGEGRETGTLFSARFPVPGNGSGHLFDILCVRNFINMQSALLRRAALKEEDYFDPKIKWGEDWLFWLKLARTAGFVYSPEPLGLYRVHAGSADTSRPERARDRVKIYLEALRFADLLPRRVISEIFYHLGVGLSRLKESETEKKCFNDYSAKRSYFHALQHNPFNWKAAVRLLLSYARART